MVIQSSQSVKFCNFHKIVKSGLTESPNYTMLEQPYPLRHFWVASLRVLRYIRVGTDTYGT